MVVRTLDIGGDKELPYLQLPKEMNPFLAIEPFAFAWKSRRFSEHNYAPYFVQVHMET